MTEENPSADALAQEQAEAAAAEAARIGGADPQPDADPEMKAVLEGGGGEAEGFEQAEEALIRQATHDDDAPADPSRTPSPERSRRTAPPPSTARVTGSTPNADRRLRAGSDG
jgi:hypothetical protein